MSGRYIVPLDMGDAAFDRSLFYLRKYIGQKDKAKSVTAYIGGAKKKIVVDSGPPDLERSVKYHPYYKTDPRRPDQQMVGALAKIGVKPEEIDLVILTHLHWDHVGEVDKFPNAQFIVSQTELHFAMDPPPCLHISYEAPQMGMEPMFMKIMPRLKTVEMKEREIVEGVRLIPTPGHSPGHMGVVVETEKGPYIIAGDSVPQYGNLKGAPEEGLRFLMSGVYTDMVAMWKSMETIDDLVEHDIARVIPGHESLVFQKNRYPE